MILINVRSQQKGTMIRLSDVNITIYIPASDVICPSQLLPSFRQLNLTVGGPFVACPGTGPEQDLMNARVRSHYEAVPHVSARLQ